MVLQDPSGTLTTGAGPTTASAAPPTLVYFPTAGPHRLRIQQRTDGAIVDQIVLSPDAFISTGAGRDQERHARSTAARSTALRRRRPRRRHRRRRRVPAPWQQQDIGAVGLPGYGEFDTLHVRVHRRRRGADVWGTADALHFVYQPLSGDGTIVARMTACRTRTSGRKPA